MFVKAVLLTILFLWLEGSLVAGRVFQQRRSPSLTDLESLNTNAKRFAAGLPPLPPIRKRQPTNVDTARRATPSFITRQGQIQVKDPNGKIIGYLSKTLKDGHFTLAKENAANTFSTYVHYSGKTSHINLRDLNKDGYYLAGIVDPGAYNPNARAILGDSLPTNPGDEPKSGTHPTVPGKSETAIWDYVASSGSLVPHWINPSHHSRTYIFYDSRPDKFYLSGAKPRVHHDSSLSEVTFTLV